MTGELRELSRSARVSAPCVPFCIESGAIVKRLLRTDTGSRQTGIQIRAAYSFPLRHSFTQKNSKAPDERVAGASTVDTLHSEWRNMLCAHTTRQKRAVGTERDDHAPYSA